MKGIISIQFNLLNNYYMLTPAIGRGSDMVPDLEVFTILRGDII